MDRTGYTKVRYRELLKNTAQQTTLLTLSNLGMMRKRLLGAGEARLRCAKCAEKRHSPRKRHELTTANARFLADHPFFESQMEGASKYRWLIQAVLNHRQNI